MLNPSPRAKHNLTQDKGHAVPGVAVSVGAENRAPILEGVSSMQRSRLPVMMVLALASAFAIADVYKWIDADGKVHYGDRPPGAGTDSRTMTLPAAPARDSERGQRSLKQQRLLDAFEAERTAEAQAAADSAAARREGRQRCEKASRELARFERATIVYTTGDSGERVSVSDQARRQASAEITAWIAKHCS